MVLHALGYMERVGSAWPAFKFLATGLYYILADAILAYSVAP
jgi:hypothetical protein